MTYIIGQEKPSLDDLSHFGVKGMRWGHHKAQPTTGGGSSGPRQPTNRELNRASRAKDKAESKKAAQEVDKEIDAARSRLSGHRQLLKDAKAQYKKDKLTIGTREARKKRNEVRNQVAIDREVAQWAKSGKETRNAVLATVGLVAVSTLVKVAAAS